jgi:hypothetical protein
MRLENSLDGSQDARVIIENEYELPGTRDLQLS